MPTVSAPADAAALADFLQALVRIPSVDPPGGEGPVASLVLDLLS
jgi:hypothetical protein